MATFIYRPSPTHTDEISIYLGKRLSLQVILFTWNWPYFYPTYNFLVHENYGMQSWVVLDVEMEVTIILCAVIPGKIYIVLLPVVNFTSV